MASLSLRAYLQKIENLIDRGETEEAIAHCKHILKKFPKHVDTYRLLGKSYLEMQRYHEASDVLQRVLSVVPDDFVSQIGMSIIREDSENLDEAIWHMERAFEIQPSNNAVQDELKRLYGRRDGVIPQKILLTRGALVRMYVRGEAYPQAIAEGIAALKEDPQRADLQLLLAKSYLRTNQINEGFRICQKILEFLPFSYEANQLIAEILILTKQSEQAEPYLEHVRMLDPYAAFVNENAPTSAKVDENAIIIDELDVDELSLSLEADATSQKSIYVEDDFDTSSLEIPTAGDSQPIEIDEDFSWMQEMMNESESEKSPSNNTQQEFPQEESDFAFDSTSESKDSPFGNLFSEEPSSDDEAFESLFAEMTDTTEEETASEPEKPLMQSQDDKEPMTMEEFFESTTSKKNESTDQALDEFAALFDEQIFENSQTQEEVNLTSDFENTFTEQSSNIPGEDLPLEQSTDDNFAAFFAEQKEGTQEPVQSAESKPKAEIEDEAVDELPDWLKELDQESKDSDIEDDLQKEIDSLFTNGDLSTSSTDQNIDSKSESLLDDEEEFTAKFLEELENEPQHPGKTRMFSMTADLSSGDSGPLPPLAENEAPAQKPSEEEMPDWLKQLEEQTNEFTSEEIVTPVSDDQEQSPVSSASNFDSLYEEEENPLQEQYAVDQQTTAGSQMPSDVEEEDDGFAWLESLAAKQSDAEEFPTDSGARDSEIVADDLTMEEPEFSSRAPSLDSMSEEEEDRLREQFRSSEPTNKAAPMPSDDEDDSFAWLESLAAKQNSSDDTDQTDQFPAEIIEEEIVETNTPEPAQPKSAVSIDAMTEEEEERLREQFKSSQQSGQATQISTEDEDDSFAWLESLAAKQGVDEDTLLTSENKRSLESPQWLQEEDISEERNTPISAPEHSAIVNEFDDSTEEVPVTISELEKSEILDNTEPESKIEEPIWVDEFATIEPEPMTEDQNQAVDAAEAEDIPNASDEDLSPIEEEIPVLPQAPEQKIIHTPKTPEEIPDWLKELEEKTSIYAMTDKDDVGQSIVDLEDVEIPGWITDVNETQQVAPYDNEDDTGPDIPEIHSEYLSDDEIEEDQSEEAFKAIGLDINRLERQLEEEQIIEHINEDRQSETDEAPEQEKPSSSIEEAVQISEEGQIQTEEELVFDIPSDFVNEILQETEPTGPVLQNNADDNELLADMENLFIENNIPEALSKADQLIEKEIYLENIIEELNKAIVDHPLDPAIFIRLGDAYIRNNEIQKALDMYQEAETLLQK